MRSVHTQSSGNNGQAIYGAGILPGEPPVVALVAQARERIDRYNALDARDTGGHIDLGYELQGIFGRIRAIDPALVEELAAECFDPALEDETDRPVLGSPDTWPDWTDAARWETDGPAGGDDLGMADPADADEEPIDPAEPFAAPEEEEPAVLSLSEWIEVQVDRYRDLATIAGEMVARSLEELAALVRLTGARDPETALARLAALDAMKLADRWNEMTH